VAFRISGSDSAAPVEAAHESDIAALQRNRISVTPLKLDLTAHEMVKRLEEGLA
jgi:5'-nucleotidase